MLIKKKKKNIYINKFLRFCDIFLRNEKFLHFFFTIYDTNLNQIETPETSIAIRNKKAYTPVKIVVQSFTYWAASNAVRVTLRSPSSTPSPPMNPRIFVTHKRNKNSQQKVNCAVLKIIFVNNSPVCLF